MLAIDKCQEYSDINNIEANEMSYYSYMSDLFLKTGN